MAGTAAAGQYRDIRADQAPQIRALGYPDMANRTVFIVVVFVFMVKLQRVAGNDI